MATSMIVPEFLSPVPSPNVQDQLLPEREGVKKKTNSTNSQHQGENQQSSYIQKSQNDNFQLHVVQYAPVQKKSILKNPNIANNSQYSQNMRFDRRVSFDNALIQNVFFEDDKAVGLKQVDDVSIHVKNVYVEVIQVCFLCNNRQLDEESTLIKVCQCQNHYVHLKCYANYLEKKMATKRPSYVEHIKCGECQTYYNHKITRRYIF